jgi:hypothetical protein
MTMTGELSTSEQEIADRLWKLAADPSPASTESIMRAVRAVRPATVPRPQQHLRRRIVLAAVLAAALLAASGVGALAASSQALPDSPAYTLRFTGEQVRLAVASPVGREELRIQFARDRFHQAEAVMAENRSNATKLIQDGSYYLGQARNDVSSLSSGEQGRVENQLDQAGADQAAAENQLNQDGAQGQQ